MKQQSLKKNAILVTHSTEVFGPPNALAAYLVRKGFDFLYIDHPLDFNPKRRSRLSIWQNGQIVSSREYPNWLSARGVNYLKDLLVTIWILLRYARGRNYLYYFGFDSLACLAGIWFRPLVNIQYLIAYNADYSTKRFHSKPLNLIYQWADQYTTKRVDKIWCVSRRIADIRRLTREDQSDVTVVPNGVFLSAVNSLGSYDQGLVYIGNLTKEKGIDKLLVALEGTKAIRLTVFGDGPERLTLAKFIANKGLAKRVTFAGRVPNQEILARLANFQAGIALYENDASYVYYSDPLKVKEYLAAGLPVIITDIPEIARKIKAAKAGVILGDKSLNEAVAEVIKNQSEMRQSALKLAKSFDWNRIYDLALASITQGEDRGRK